MGLWARRYSQYENNFLSINKVALLHFLIKLKALEGVRSLDKEISNKKKYWLARDKFMTFLAEKYENKFINALNDFRDAQADLVAAAIATGRSSSINDIRKF